MVLFWAMGLIMMLLPGKLPRGMAILVFIFELPQIARPQTLWLEGPLKIQFIPLPALDALYGYTFFLMWTFIAYVNYMETILRDWKTMRKKV
jgi:hypothetical protein